MSKANFYNKGLLRGTVSKTELIKYGSDKPQKQFLSVEVNTSKNNKVRAILFPTKSDPNKAKNLNKQFPVGAAVNISGNIQEKEYESKSGGMNTERSVQAFSMMALDESVDKKATFVLQGIVKRIKQRAGGVEVVVEYKESYKDKEGNIVDKEPLEFTLFAEDEDIIDDHDVETGCSAKFKGQILNSLKEDEYGDIVGSVQMFKIERIESVVDADDLTEEDEDLPY